MRANKWKYELQTDRDEERENDLHFHQSVDSLSRLDNSIIFHRGAQSKEKRNAGRLCCATQQPEMKWL